MRPIAVYFPLITFNYAYSVPQNIYKSIDTSITNRTAPPATNRNSGIITFIPGEAWINKNSIRGFYCITTKAGVTVGKSTDKIVRKNKEEARLYPSAPPYLSTYIPTYLPVLAFSTTRTRIFIADR